MKIMLKNGVLWDPDIERGFFPSTSRHGHGPSVYDAAYFNKYVVYAKTPLGKALTKARLDMVNRHYRFDGHLVDIGIGSGQFVEARGFRTYGYDVNPDGIRWLLDRDLWWDPFAYRPTAVTCWDSIEHMDDPDILISRVIRYIFVSLPIFTGPEHIIKSRHFRPSEHIWYWTRDGFVRTLSDAGFVLVEENCMETELGREDIRSFAFRRLVESSR